MVAFLLLQGATLADATDIAQDTMIKAHKGWHRIDHPRAWAHRVASRALVCRMLTNRDIPVEQPPELNPLLRTTDIECWEQRHDLLLALAQLPHRQQQIMAWTLADYTPTEIADELKMTSGAVRQNQLRARRTLINLLTSKDGDQ